MERSRIWGYCDACEAPLVEGVKLNLAPGPKPDTWLAYCDTCVREAEERLRAHKPS
jgi:hypothetical protein